MCEMADDVVVALMGLSSLRRKHSGIRAPRTDHRQVPPNTVSRTIKFAVLSSTCTTIEMRATIGC